MDEELLNQAASTTISEHRDYVERWLSHTPGSWGFLAGRSILKARELLGRSLSEPERRTIWSSLWRQLSEIRHEKP